MSHHGSGFDYMRLTTERVHEGLNFRRNHRFFLLYGRHTDDEFLTTSYYRAALRRTLWATLKENQLRRVIFYNGAHKLFFLDEESARLSAKSERGGAAPAPAGGVGRGRRQAGPLGASRNVLERHPALPPRTAPPDASAVDVRQEIIPLASANGGVAMTDAAVLSNLNYFFADDSVRTALVIEDIEDFSRIESGVKRQLAARLREWSAFGTRNQNVMLFITNREPLDEASLGMMRQLSSEFSEIANLVNVALGDKRADAGGFTLYMPSPYEGEVERLLNAFRLRRDLPVEWEEYWNLVRWVSAAAAHRQLKELGGLLEESWHKGARELSLATAKRFEWVDGDPDPRPASTRLSELTGRGELKQQIERFTKLLKAQQVRRRNDPSLKTEPPNLHLVLTGNPGTGKTILARLIGEIYRELGLLRRGHVVECRADDLVAQHLGGTAPKTNAKINEALDGVLFVDEAYMLSKDEHGDFGQKAIDTIMARMENERHCLAVIMAGYKNEMERVLASNSGLRSRFGERGILHFEDYSPEELFGIFERMIGTQGFVIGDEMRGTMRSLFARVYVFRNDPELFPPDGNGNPTYANARTVREEFVQAMIEEQAMRLGGAASDELTADDIPAKYRELLRTAQPQNEELERIILELNSLVGLDSVKQFVQELVMEHYLINQGVQVSSVPQTRHMMFLGNAGTGKTTVAEIIGKIFKNLNILSKGKFASAKREDLVAEYLGQTAPKTKDVVVKALDGVLFIDEAYSLAQDAHDVYGKECIATLLPLMESYRDRLVVIFAGYTEEMELFLNANSGMRSRIGYVVDFPDYSPEEMLEIFLRMAAKDGFEVPEEVRRDIGHQLGRLRSQDRERSGNARDVRVNFYEKMLMRFKKRLYATMQSGGRQEDCARCFELSDVPSYVTDAVESITQV
jgi:SpoVK/Ycf46/Vps4 family AAA+-type ATPase